MIEVVVWVCCYLVFALFAMKVMYWSFEHTIDGKGDKVLLAVITGLAWPVTLVVCSAAGILAILFPGE